jgi:hypothetical protein
LQPPPSPPPSPPPPPSSPDGLPSCASAPSSGVYDIRAGGGIIEVFCWITNGAAYVKVLESAANGVLADNTGAVGGAVSQSWAPQSTDGQGNGVERKLSDQDINRLMSVVATPVFKFVSSSPSNSLFITATQSFSFSSSGMGIYGSASTALRSKNTAGAPPSMTTTQGGTGDWIGSQGEGCDRWFMGHCGGGCKCYGSGGSGSVCFSGGSSCGGYNHLQYLAGYIYHGQVA